MVSSTRYNKLRILIYKFDWPILMRKSNHQKLENSLEAERQSNFCISRLGLRDTEHKCGETIKSIPIWKEVRGFLKLSLSSLHI
ncbi:unnamed protein product [Calypogeia fissa]